MGKRKQGFERVPHKVRRYVKQRDKVCVVCGDTKSLQLHHLIPRGEYDDSVYKLERGVNSPNNLAVVCKSCHKAIHKHPEMMRKMREYQELRFGVGGI